MKTEPDSVVSRAYPYALGAEKSVLSVLLQYPLEYLGVAVEEKITAEHFHLPGHSTLFPILVEISAAGQEIELVSLVQRLLDRGLLDRVGGPAGITDIYTYAPSPTHFRFHVGILRQKLVLRRLLSLATKTQEAVFDSPDESEQLLEETEREIMAIREGIQIERSDSQKESVTRIIEAFQRRLAGEKDARGISSGFEDLDRMISGLSPGDMFVIGARPSMGKTSLMMNIVEHVCFSEGVPTLVFSAEMSRDKINERLVFGRAKYASSNLNGISLPGRGDLLRIKRSAVEVSSAKLFIVDKAGPTISYLRAVARRHKREHGIGLIAIDYLQLLKGCSKQATNSREREISEISAGIKGLAKDLGLPVIVLAQLNRDAEKRGGKVPGKPKMSDLRDSGSIEQDADVIGLLHRSAYYAETEVQKQAEAGRAELDIAKNRNGSTGVIPLTFVAELMRFESGAPAWKPVPEKEPRNRFDS